MSELVDRTNGQSTAKSNSNNNNNNSSGSSNSKVSGVVKFYSVQKCYGFIKRDDTKEYVFVHSKSVTGKNQRRVTRSLAKGEHVEFDVVMSDRSPEAINVTGLNDGPVLGSEYALITMQWHQYDSYKQQLLQSGGITPRERSPRARRFFHRRQPRDGNYSNRNGSGNAAGMRNDRGGDRRRHRRPVPASSSSNNKGDTNNQEQNHENNSENKQKSRRRFNRNRKPKSTIDDQNKMSDDKTGVLQMTTSNLTTLLSELSMGVNSLNTANSTSSESLDFEKINTEDTNLCSATSSRLAASFNKGN